MTIDESEGRIYKQELQALFHRNRGEPPAIGTPDHARFNALRDLLSEAFGEEHIAVIFAEAKLLATPK
jgi:hypothetical protein